MNMRRNVMLLRWMFVFVPQLMFQLSSAAAEALPDLTCNITKEPDESFIYLLSQSPLSPSCTTSWEDENQTSLARGHKYDKEKVYSLTNCSITMKHCKSFLRYLRQCSGVREEARCNVNCSAVFEQFPGPHAVNTTSNCLFRSFCPFQLLVGLGITGILLVVLFFVARYLLKFISKYRGKSEADTTTYSSVNGDITMV